MSNTVKNFTTFVNEDNMSDDEWKDHDKMVNLGMIPKEKETFSIVNHRGSVILDQLPESFIDFIIELKRMNDLFKNKRYSTAEEVKSKLTEELEDLMQDLS